MLTALLQGTYAAIDPILILKLERIINYIGIPRILQNDVWGCSYFKENDFRDQS